MSRQPTASSPQPRPRRRLSAGERRNALLDAAMSVFAARGYEGTGTKDIAAAAGVSEALIYGHFESKQALHAALLESKSSELLRHLRAATAEDAPDDGTLFRLGLAAIFGFADENPVAWRLLFRDAPADPVLASAQGRVQQATTAAIATLLAERCEFQLPRDVEPAVATRAIAALLKGALDGLANWWFDHRELTRDQVVSLMMDVVWTGLDQLRVTRARDSRGSP
jgi:AcrR family transcriptional regulator